MRVPALLLLLAALFLPGCLFPGDDHDEDEQRDVSSAEVVAALRWKVDLEPELSSLAGGDCEVTVAEGVVNVKLTPGPRGLPGAATLRRMSLRIQDVTSIPPGRQIMRTTRGKLLFVNGEAAGR